ncbi:MAG: hypothetical protein JXR65_08000 [Bacteroidales bacterium]|nr:hypothetical protein [Bacteroidales bacterium]
MFRSYILVLFFMFLPVFKASAGWVITEQSTNKYGNKTFQTTFIQGNYIRLDAPTLVSIFDLKNDKIILLFPQDRAYWEGSADQLQQQFRDLMVKQLQIIISHAPDTQRDSLQKIYQHLSSSNFNQEDSNAVLKPVLQVVKTSQTLNILGYNTSMFEIKTDSILLEKIWVTNKIKPYLNIPIKETLKLTNAINPFSGVTVIPVSNEYMQILQNGAVLKREFYTSGNKVQSAQVSDIKEVKIVETIFEIPANYELMTIEQVMNLDMNRNILNPVLQDKEQRINLSPPPPFKSNNKFPDKNIQN